MKFEITRSLVVCVAAALVGCQTAPLSFLDGQPQTRTDTSLYPLKVVSVDGSIQFHNPVQVAPGPRWLTLEAVPGAGARNGVQRSYVFKVEPCTRYYLAAQRTSPMATDWSLIIESKESVTGCNPELELKNASAVAPAPAASSGSK
jgi:hypothetical protein